MSANPATIAITWLSHFALAVESGDIVSVLSGFLPDGSLRDDLIFTWDVRSLRGHQAIAGYLSDALARAQLFNFNVILDEPLLAPQHGLVSPTRPGLSFAFTFETPIAHGRGFVRLLQQGNEWMAWSVFTQMKDLKGHEEQGPELGSYGGHTLSFESVSKDRRAEIERDPCVVIGTSRSSWHHILFSSRCGSVGAGQAGLMTAARLKQMGLRTLVLERNERVGDNWRKRYPTLTLHTVKTHHACELSRCIVLRMILTDLLK